ncbi:MAG: hypothetical protein ACI4HK_02285 [Ruminococcus sp.]
MFKKAILLLLSAWSIFLCGCDNSKRIDKALIVECIVVDENEYSFIYLAEEDRSDSVKIRAESLEKALNTLKNERKPEVVLSKLELIAFSENSASDKFYSTLKYVRCNYSVSPSVYTAVCSDEVIKLLDKPVTLEKCTEQIMLLEKKDADISSTLLKMNNNLGKSKKSLLYFPHISSNDGITGEKFEIMIKK